MKPLVGRQVNIIDFWHNPKYSCHCHSQSQLKPHTAQLIYLKSFPLSLEQKLLNAAPDVYFRKQTWWLSKQGSSVENVTGYLDPLILSSHGQISHYSFLFLQDLKDYFRAAGEITYTNAHKPRQGEG